MPPDRRLLRENRSVWDGMKRYHYETGQWVQWFRFNPAATTSHPTYGTGPQRVWYPSITIPVFMGIFSRAQQNLGDDQGLYLVSTVKLIMSYDAFFSSTIPDPDSTGQDHLNDRFGFDGTLFGVDSFLPRGRSASQFLTISVDAHEVAIEELQEDVDYTGQWSPYITAS